MEKKTRKLLLKKSRNTPFGIDSKGNKGGDKILTDTICGDPHGTQNNCYPFTEAKDCDTPTWNDGCQISLIECEDPGQTWVFACDDRDDNGTPGWCGWAHETGGGETGIFSWVFCGS